MSSTCHLSSEQSRLHGGGQSGEGGVLDKLKKRAGRGGGGRQNKVILETRERS